MSVAITLQPSAANLMAAARPIPVEQQQQQHQQQQQPLNLIFRHKIDWLMFNVVPIARNAEN